MGETGITQKLFLSCDRGLTIYGSLLGKKFTALLGLDPFFSRTGRTVMFIKPLYASSRLLSMINVFIPGEGSNLSHKSFLGANLFPTLCQSLSEAISN